MYDALYVSKSALSDVLSFIKHEEEMPHLSHLQHKAFCWKCIIQKQHSGRNRIYVKIGGWGSCIQHLKITSTCPRSWYYNTTKTGLKNTLWYLTKSTWHCTHTAPVSDWIMLTFNTFLDLLQQALRINSCWASREHTPLSHTLTHTHTHAHIYILKKFASQEQTFFPSIQYLV